MPKLPPHKHKVNADYARRAVLTSPARKSPFHRRALRGLEEAILLGLYTLPALICWLTNVRFLHVSNTHRIGHLAAEMDCYLKELTLRQIRPPRALLLIKPGKIANQTMCDIWAKHVCIVTTRLPYKLLLPFMRFRSITRNLGDPIVAVDGAATYQKTLAAWHGRTPVAELPIGLEERGQAALRRLGVPDGAWFVCIHVRDASYSPGDEKIHEHRNSRIESYDSAMHEIVARGGYCIRVGEATLTPLAPATGIVDYATSPEKSDEMDIYLCARARFFLGNTSGLCMVATIFNVPSALMNMIPLGACYSLRPGDISIPKKLHAADGTLLRYDDIFESSVSTFRYAGLYREHGINIEDNSAEEILDVTREMLDRLDGTFTATPEDEANQQAFRRLLQPHHYAYESEARIGRDFLRSHRQLY